MDTLLKVLTRPWTTYFLWLVSSEDQLRFGELKARMPAISSKVLTDHLRMLEGAGLIDREDKPTIFPLGPLCPDAAGGRIQGSP